ncbi:MAG: hypothetical protein WCW26_00445 [Candidatus Buchananbacteria bacterium]
MRLVNRINEFFSSKPIWSYLLLLIITVSFFAYLANSPTLADPDSFYHAKMALVLAQRGAITEFPWLSATSLKYSFIDHHFLYHLLLIPFVSLFPPLIGLKIATVIFASLAILTIFWFLRRLQVRGAFWYVLFLLTVNPFIFRLNLAKAQALAILMLFVILYLLFHYRYLGLVLACCFYVWLYGGWPITLVLLAVFILANWLWQYQQKGWLGIRLKQGKSKPIRQNFYLGLAIVSGLAAGLFFSPYFPKNFDFYWQQSFKIAVINYQYLINVGGEWYPYAINDLIIAAFPFFGLLILALLAFLITLKKQSAGAWFFLILSLLFLALTLKSRRYVEYFIPVALCFSAVSLNAFWLSQKTKMEKLRPKSFWVLIPVFLILGFSPIFARDFKDLILNNRNGFGLNKFQAPAEWLKQNSAPGDIVFHSDWDEFPILFYYNDINYYLVGLDPTFMYSYDRDLYQRWSELTTGKTKDEMYQTIKEVFGSRYVFVDFNQNADFDKNLSENFYFKKVFENSEARIYQVN